MRTETFHAGQRFARRVILGMVLASVPAPVAAQDTPEMLAAMRGHLPPVPPVVPERNTLPAELRTEIPDTVVEMHRWNDDPAKRFVIVHGRRIEEGGVIDRDLWLRQIRQDGVVMQFRDQFFFQSR